MSLLRTCALVLALGLCAGPAHADLFIGVDRLFGVANHKQTIEGASNTSRTDFAFALTSPSSVYAAPRLAVDVLTDNGLTVGGALGLVTSGVTVESQGVVSSTTDTDGFTFLLAPRVGLLLPASGRVSLHLRGGVTYYQSSANGTIELSQRGVSLNLEPTAAIALVGNVALTASLIADLPLWGESKFEGTLASVTRDTSLRQLGLLLGFAFRL